MNGRSRRQSNRALLFTVAVAVPSLWAPIAWAQAPGQGQTQHQAQGQGQTQPQSQTQGQAQGQTPAQGQTQTPPTPTGQRVVVLAATGSAPQDQRDTVEDAIAHAVQSLGDEALTDRPPAEPGATPPPPPTTANEMRAVAEIQGAEWVVVPRVTPGTAGHYQLLLRVGWAPQTRVEELDADIAVADQAERLEDILRAMLRPAGLGDEAVQLATGGELAQRRQAQEAAQRAREQAAARAAEQARRARQAQAQREAQARERQRRATAARTAEQRWAGRERYGQHGGPWLVSAGVGFGPILVHEAKRSGGVLWDIEARVGRSIGLLPGLELRGGFDAVSGASSGFTLFAGAVYLHSFFADLPLFLGGGVDAGYQQTLTGNREPSGMIRVSGLVDFRVANQIMLEAALPELMILTAHHGVMTLGLSLRVGYRF